MNITAGKESPEKRVTAEEFWELAAGRLCELVNGEVVELTPSGGRHGSIERKLGLVLGNYLEQHPTGDLSVGDTGYTIRRNPDTVRGPDLGLVFSERIPADGVPEAFWPIPPDLAVEIVSPSDTVRRVEGQVRDWLDAGTREVWVVDPRRREIRRHDLQSEVKVFGADATFQSELLPGFEFNVGEMLDV